MRLSYTYVKGLNNLTDRPTFRLLELSCNIQNLFKVENCNEYGEKEKNSQLDKLT